ncbi:hypothetical protein ACFLWG_04285 [Chloroflexota bacterium]
MDNRSPPSQIPEIICYVACDCITTELTPETGHIGLGKFGETPDLRLIEGSTCIKTTKRVTLDVDRITLSIGKDRIFAAGFMVNGPMSIFENIRDGCHYCIMYVGLRL